MPETTERERLSRLLIVEDEEGQLRTLTDLMEDEGFDVIGCTTAAEALKHIDRENFGVAVVDLHLPDLNGTELLDRINALNGKIRVIINTAYASFGSAKEALNLGAFAYVEKAGDPSELIRHVHAAARWHLDRYAKNLEEAVADRTAELRQTNEELRKEIVERKKTQAALREGEERYRAIAEDMPVLICRFLPDGEITYVNDSYCRFFKRTPAELIGSSFLSLIPEVDRETVMANITSLTADSPTQSHEHQVGAPGGDIRWQRWTNRALFNAEGEAVAYQAIGEDITDRKRAEVALRESEEKLRNIVENSTNMFYSHGPDHVLTYMSPQSSHILDCKPEDATIRWTEFATDNPANEIGYQLTQKPSTLSLSRMLANSALRCSESVHIFDVGIAFSSSTDS